MFFSRENQFGPFSTVIGRMRSINLIDDQELDSLTRIGLRESTGKCPYIRDVTQSLRESLDANELETARSLVQGMLFMDDAT